MINNYIQTKNNPPKRSVLEEIGNAITHGLGALFAIVATIFMCQKSNNQKEVVVAIVYGACMFLQMLSSCLYHSFKYGTTVKRVFRRFDYCSIYLLIGGTFVPLFLLYWGNTLGTVMCIIQWILIITGITFVAVFGPARFRWIHFVLYFIMGWSGLMFVKDWLGESIQLFAWMITGGIIYSLGMIPFVLKKKKSAHFIWHFFVLFGAITQWIGIYLYIF